MALSARASSSHSHPGDGAQNHFNHARATTTASDGKSALNRHLQATSCKEPMGTSWSLNSGQSDPHQSAPPWLRSTAPRNFFTATTSRQPPLLPHYGPTTPGKPGKTNGSTNIPSTANPHQDHQPQTESSRPRNALKQTYRLRSKSSLTPIGAAGTEITTWRPLTRLALRPGSTNLKPTLRNSKSKTPNSSTGSRRRPQPMQPPTPNSPQSPNRSAPTRPSSRRSTKMSMSVTKSCDGKCCRALATSRPSCRKNIARSDYVTLDPADHPPCARNCNHNQLDQATPCSLVATPTQPYHACTRRQCLRDAFTPSSNTAWVYYANPSFQTGYTCSLRDAALSHHDSEPPGATSTNLCSSIPSRLPPRFPLFPRPISPSCTTRGSENRPNSYHSYGPIRS